MYTILFAGLELVFTDNQQWADNDTFTVVSKSNDEEYWIDYDAREIQDQELIDWEDPEFIWKADGQLVYEKG